ncbi:MAG: tRNA 2-thiouridine(34) synthase MnmA [Bifidobacteriaceae bacterium]|jgi:tRNA-specific 2-thiouridylase|nr:tRNA 2-thiouridine(34) synthase MnmA [Bifidobacteriaceae bacterium]
MRVLAALSGGVDSAVSAARIQAAGHEVVGVHMALMRHRAAIRQGSRGCCSIEDASDARRAADRLGIDFYVWDLSEEFEDLVVRDFLDTYAAGRTPNPCIRCNEFIKFQVLLRRAVALGFDAVATGHYARLEVAAPPWVGVHGPVEHSAPGGSGPRPGGVILRRAVDLAKDQSYVLAAAGPAALRRCLFPLGTAPSKAAVRAEAAALGLPVAAKPDSYDVCFVADGDTKRFLRARLGAQPGVIVDQSGTEVGQHDGAYQFTVGQRRGLRLSRPGADGRPRYVTSVDPAAGVVRVGPVEALDVSRFGLRGPVFLDAGAPAALAAGGTLGCDVQIRAHGAPLACEVSAAPGGSADALEVALVDSHRGVASGQTAVLYDGDRVICSGTIERTK